MNNSLATQQTALLGKLSREIRQLETARQGGSHQPAISSGCPALDGLLPRGGYLPGSVIEYLRTTPACGATSLALAAAASAMRSSGGFLVLVDTGQSFYPAALLSQGIDLAQVVFVRPQSLADALWAVDQALRTVAVAAVVAELERIDDRSARRLQLAAEHGQGLALLLRSAAARRQPSWAEVQWLVHPRESRFLERRPAGQRPVGQRPVGQRPVERGAAARVAASARAPRLRLAGNRGLQVQLARVRGGQAGAWAWLEIDALSGAIQSAPSQATRRERNRHEPAAQTAASSAVHLASQLAHPTPRSRRAAAG